MNDNFLKINIHILEAKHLKSRDESQSSDPFVSIKIFDKVQSTQVIYDSLNCIFDKRFFFDFENLSDHDIDIGKISFVVYDSNTWKRNTIIGSYDMEITYVMENKLNKQWIVLTDPTNKYSGTQGFLCVSLNVLKNDDKVIYENRNDETLDLLIPVHMKKDTYYFVCVLHCIKYGILDNLFVKLQFCNGQHCCSSVVYHENPVYNQQLHLPIIFPSMNNIIEISIISKSNLQEVVLCSKFITISSINKHKERLPSWYHFSVHEKNISYYKASLLGHFYLEKVQQPSINTFDIVPSENGVKLVKVDSYEKQQHMMIVNEPQYYECVIFCNVYEVHNIESTFFQNEKYKILIQYKNDSIHSSIKEIKNNKLIFYEQLKLYTNIEKSIINQDYVYIYLLKNKNVIGFCTEILENVMISKDPKWFKIGESHLLLNVNIYKKTQIPKQLDPFIKAETKVFYLKIHLYQGYFEKYGNYFIEFNVHDKTIKSSKSIQVSLCDFYEVLNLELNLLNDKSLMPNVYVKLYNETDIIDSFCFHILDKINVLYFEKVKSSISCHITLNNVYKPDTFLKQIKYSYISRFVVLGLREFEYGFLTKKLRFNIKINEENQFTDKVECKKNINIFGIYDFIVNQYSEKQYCIIDIEDVTLYSSKMGECLVTIQDIQNEDDVIYEHVNNERDDIPIYLKNRLLLHNDLESFVKTPLPFETWEIRNKYNKVIGELIGYTRKFDNDIIKKQIISHENERVVFKNEKVNVRIYILRCLNLVAKDISGSSDPYVVLSIDDVIHKTKTINQNLNPEFHESFEFKNILIPSCGYLNIDVYDYDVASQDDYIGGTSINLTNRWYHDEWNNFTQKPLELRTLKHKNARGPQGIIELWVDIFTQYEAKMYKQIDISLPPIKPFVIRLIVWNAKKLACNDMNNMNDLYISGIFGDSKKCTDIHWRSSNRRGNFNYRLLWDIELPVKRLYSKITIQAWDQDIIGESDLIGEGVIELYDLFKKAYETLLPQRYNDNERDIWIELFHSDYPNISRGFVRISLEVVSKFYAEQHPAGEGRGSPNINPTLQEPLRPSFQLSRPYELLADVLGEEAYNKLKFAVISFCFCGPFFFILWLWVQIKSAFGIKYSWE